MYNTSIVPYTSNDVKSYSWIQPLPERFLSQLNIKISNEVTLIAGPLKHPDRTYFDMLPPSCERPSYLVKNEGFKVMPNVKKGLFPCHCWHDINVFDPPPPVPSGVLWENPPPLNFEDFPLATLVCGVDRTERLRQTNGLKQITTPNILLIGPKHTGKKTMLCSLAKKGIAFHSCKYCSGTLADLNIFPNTRVRVCIYCADYPDDDLKDLRLDLYGKADSVILCFEATKLDTLEMVQQCFKEIRSYDPLMHGVLLCTRSDLRYYDQVLEDNIPTVSKVLGSETANKLGLDYAECLSNFKTGVEEIFVNAGYIAFTHKVSKAFKMLRLEDPNDKVKISHDAVLTSVKILPVGDWVFERGLNPGSKVISKSLGSENFMYAACEGYSYVHLQIINFKLISVIKTERLKYMADHVGRNADVFWLYFNPLEKNAKEICACIEETTRRVRKLSNAPIVVLSVKNFYQNEQDMMDVRSYVSSKSFLILQEFPVHSAHNCKHLLDDVIRWGIHHLHLKRNIEKRALYVP